MKICITSNGDNLESTIDPRFGRCSYFVFWHSEDNSFEAIVNPNINLGSGAGIQSAQLVVSKKPDLVITGELGPKAAQILRIANLPVIAMESGIIKEVLAKYKDSKIPDAILSSSEKSEIQSDYQVNYRRVGLGRGPCGGDMRMGYGGRRKGGCGMGIGRINRGRRKIRGGVEGGRD